MTDSQEKPFGPPGDPSRHLAFPELEARLNSLPKLSRDRGEITLIVQRREDGERETPEQALLTLEDGVAGDKWSLHPSRKPDAQIAVMNHRVATFIANGQPLTVFGDNLFVDLDLSAENLPTGTRLQVGDAVVEVTPMPHNGCAKFQQRFGPDALRFVSKPETRALNLRGIYWKVVTAGELKVGAPIQVISRPTPNENPA